MVHLPKYLGSERGAPLSQRQEQHPRSLSVRDRAVPHLLRYPETLAKRGEPIVRQPRQQHFGQEVRVVHTFAVAYAGTTQELYVESENILANDR